MRKGRGGAVKAVLELT